MRDAWVYSTSDDAAEQLAGALAELGFGPRLLDPHDGLLATGADGAAVRRPALAVVVGSAAALLDRLRSLHELQEVPFMLAVTPEQLPPAASVAVDELLVLPFTLPELEARVARATRDLHATASGGSVRAGSLEVNLQTYQVLIGGQPIAFTYMEYELLKFLITHPNRVFSREALLRSVWGYDYYGGARTVDVHVLRVRAKLGQEHAARIRTIRSVGYLFDLRTAPPGAP